MTEQGPKYQKVNDCQRHMKNMIMCLNYEELKCY